MSKSPPNWYKRYKTSGSAESKASYVGNCTDIFAPDGDCLLNIFLNVSDFAGKEEEIREALAEGREVLLSLDEFQKLTNVNEVLGKRNLENDFEFYFYPETEFSPTVYVAYSIEEGIHYFWV